MKSHLKFWSSHCCQSLRSRVAVALLSLACHDFCLAQGNFTPLHITFDGPPAPAPGTAYKTKQYYESNLAFTPIDPDALFAGFVRRRGGGDGSVGWPDNGTAYVQATLTSTLKFSSLDAIPFDLVSVDLAEYSSVVSEPVTVQFVGYRADGTTVRIDLTTDGVFDGPGPVADFQTFTFDDRFRGLLRVEIPSEGWSLDNLRLAIPEPSGVALLALGAGCFLVRRRR